MYCPKGIKIILRALSVIITFFVFTPSIQAEDLCVASLKRPLSGEWRNNPHYTRACPLASQLVTWLRLKEGKKFASFPEYIAFLDQHPDWPWEHKLRKHAEAGMPSDVDLKTLEKLYRKAPPKTFKGALTYIKKLLRHNHTTEARRQLHLAWTALELTAQEQNDFLHTFRSQLTPHDHEGRIRALLKKEQTKLARLLLPLFNPQRQKDLLLRMALIEQHPNAQAFIKPNHKLLQDQDLFYDYIRQGRKQNNPAVITQLARFSPPSHGHDQDWWKERGILARRALETGQHQVAYDLVKHHGLKEGVEFVDAEFLAGWIAFRHLKNFEKANTHFQHLLKSARGPVSKAKASYWIGKIQEAVGKKDSAHQWYQQAAHHKTTFYGQIAAKKIHQKSTPSLKPLKMSAQEQAEFMKRNFVKISQLLVKAGLKADALDFLYLAGKRAKSHKERLLVFYITNQLLKDYSVTLANEIKPYTDVPYLEAYPRLPSHYTFQADPALIHAIIRKESAFINNRVSPKNALGLMQILPSTGQFMAKNLNIDFKQERLQDPSYNIKLGSAYINHLLNKYNGSYILAVAAYNAGTKPVSEWIACFGDPRNPSVDPIDWIENIPYAETRNYVQRVLETREVYNTILHRKVESR